MPATRSMRSKRPAYRGMDDDEVQKQLFMMEGRIAHMGWDLGEVWQLLLKHQEQLDALQASLQAALQSLQAALQDASQRTHATRAKGGGRRRKSRGRSKSGGRR